MPKTFECTACGKYTNNGNKFHKLCTFCNRKRLHKNKPKKEPTGEAKMFEEIWEERPHICTECNKPLGDEPRVHYFSHIKPKGKYPELRLKKTNIDILCFDCHYERDFG